MIPNNINFRGIPIAKTKIAENNLTLYKLTSRDKEFTDRLYHSLNLPELYPGFNKLQYGIWDEVTHLGLSQTYEKNQNTMLITADNRPCGVLNYSAHSPKFNLNYVSTWPIKIGQKVPLAGKTLFMEFFRQFLNSDCRTIELCALKYAPFSAISKYLSLGFKPRGGDNFRELMRTDRESAAKTLQKLEQSINLSSVKDSNDYDLIQRLEI